MDIKWPANVTQQTSGRARNEAVWGERRTRDKGHSYYCMIQTINLLLFTKRYHKLPCPFPHLSGADQRGRSHLFMGSWGKNASALMAKLRVWVMVVVGIQPRGHTAFPNPWRSSPALHTYRLMMCPLGTCSSGWETLYFLITEHPNTAGSPSTLHILWLGANFKNRFPGSHERITET